MQLNTLIASLCIAVLMTTQADGQCSTSSVAVFAAARDITLRGPSSQVPFDVVLVDTHDGFDATQSVYTVRQTGFYFISLSAGAPAYQGINYTLHGASSSPSILLTHTQFDGELVTSRDDIQYLIEGQQLYLTSQFDLYSDGFMQTTVSGFRINDFVSADNVFFRAARTTSYLPTGTIPFDKLVINVGRAWDTCNGTQMIVPQTGIYFISISSASIPNTRQVAELRVNNIVRARAFIHANVFPGVDTSGQSVLLQLNANDVVQLSSAYGNIHSDSGHQLALQGFLYEPLHAQKVAWTLTLPINVQTYIYGPADVNYTTVMLNEGAAWNSTLGLINIPTSGIYFIRLSGTSWPAQYRFNLVLSVNGQPFISVIEKINVNRDSYNLRSRSLVHHFNQADQLVVSVPTGYNLYNYLYDAVFSGFLIQPDVN